MYFKNVSFDFGINNFVAPSYETVLQSAGIDC